MTGILERSGWADAAREPLAGDASARRYVRLRRKSGTAILMTDPGGDVRPFARIARHLASLGLSAPAILAEDAEAGMLLLEDLGDGLVARLAGDPGRERALYGDAIDTLAALHRHLAPPGLPLATPDALAAMTDLAFTHYARLPAGAAAGAADALRPILARHAAPEGLCVLRDYHAENILHLPGRTGPARAGLLDFQDAMEGHAAYDLVSLIRDARRDLHPGTAEACIARYLQATGRDADAFGAALATLGVQRNLRILGVFARLAQQGKPRYLALLPRVWDHLQTDLAHPALAPLRPALAALPEPTKAHRAMLETPCPTP